ncbi:hypothetical protein FKW77_001755 [Venturia effusa]|uniref:Uncharacterized protein n=1 Tax=Venturia effusa TaxID=50376 RepID=A0A517LBW2_9PEZI|nr:hypothetical protein FKW77_001755 [Venturia effusa]
MSRLQAEQLPPNPSTRPNVRIAQLSAIRPQRKVFRGPQISRNRDDYVRETLLFKTTRTSLTKTLWMTAHRSAHTSIETRHKSGLCVVNKWRGRGGMTGSLSTNGSAKSRAKDGTSLANAYSSVETV